MSEVLCNFWPLFWALLAVSRASGEKNPTELPVHHCDSIIKRQVVRENLEMMSGDQLSPLYGPDPNHSNVLKSVPEVNVAGGGGGHDLNGRAWDLPLKAGSEPS